MRIIFFLFVLFMSVSISAQKVVVEGTVMSLIYADEHENTVPGVAIKDAKTGKTLDKTDTYGKFKFKYDISQNKKFIVERKEFKSKTWTYKKTAKPIVIYINPDSDKFVKVTKGKAIGEDGKPIQGAKAINSYYKNTEYSDKNGEFEIRIPNPKYLEQWESKSEADNLKVTISKSGMKVAEIHPTYQSTLEDLIVKLHPIKTKSTDDGEIASVDSQYYEIIESDIDKNLVQLDTIKKLSSKDVAELKEYISYLEDKLDHHQYNYHHEDLGQSRTVNHILHVKLDSLKTQVVQKETKLKVVEKERNYLRWIILAIILIIIPTIIAILTYRSKKKTEQLNVELDRQNKELNEAYSDIKSSVLYAQKIQKTVLVELSVIKENFKDAFIFYKPKDIVSGDFYWFANVGDKLVLAAVDCTGHGVPGAFMTMMGNSLMSEIVNTFRVTSPAKILSLLHEKVVENLQSGDDKLQDGMDASIAVISPNEGKLYFCGANNPLYFIADGKLESLEAHKRGIGGHWSVTEEKFVDVEMNIKDINSFYLFSDGFADQFGGERDKKFMKKNFQKLLLEASEKAFAKQEEYIITSFESWKGANEQTDDILVIGVEL